MPSPSPTGSRTRGSRSIAIAPHRRTVVAPANPAAVYDVIIAGDLTRHDDRAFRIAEEIRHHAAAGRRVGLLQATRPLAGRRIAPEVQTTVRRGHAAVVEPAAAPLTEQLVLHAPSEVSWDARRLAPVAAERAILVCHSVADYQVPRLRQRLPRVADVCWAPTNPWLRQSAPARLPLLPDDWRPPAATTPSPARPAASRPRPVIAWLTGSETLPPPAAPEGVDLLQLPLAGSGLTDLSLDRLLQLDGLAFYPTETRMALPDTIIRRALDQGVAVAMPRHLRPHYGTGPLYSAPARAVSELARRFSQAADAPALRPKRPARGQHRAAGGERPRPVMFLPSNGVGVGHVTRLLAIARRLPPQVPVVFVSQAQAMGVIERFGYLAEYLPSATYVGGSFETWDAWYRVELERLIDAYDPGLVVYDGNNPSHGLVQAVAPRRDCRLAWVRRGLWGNATSPFLDNSRWFDLILEPGELDGQPDDGVTAERRDEARLLAPVRLLEEPELLSRPAAAAALGLDPERSAVLIQLGAGYNRDIVSLIDHLVDLLQPVPDLQICIAEWVNGAQSLNLWPGVRILRGHPLSQYVRAFDFTIAAAGYNTFHELLGYAVPTIFIANRHPTMDNQAGRAEYAQELHAAFEIGEDDLSDLPELLTLMLNPQAREFLAGKCRELARPNGAGEAAGALMQLLEVAC